MQGRRISISPLDYFSAAMEDIPTAADTASAVQALGIAAKRLGDSFYQLDQESDGVFSAIRNLAVEVQSLGEECELINDRLAKVLHKSDRGSTFPSDLNVRIWNSIAAQVQETGQTLQNLELDLRGSQEEPLSASSQAAYPNETNNGQDQITIIRAKVERHGENLRTTLLLINA